MRLLDRFWRDQQGASAMEFALASPVLVLILAGIAQLGILFMANAGLKNAVAEGARYATIYPRPTNTQIQGVISSRRFGLTAANLSTPTLTPGVADGANYLDVSASYTVNLNFVFFNINGITLTETRRAFVNPA